MQRECIIHDCARRRKYSYYCSMHYERIRVRGNVGGSAPERVTGSVEERFWSKVSKAGRMPDFRDALVSVTAADGNCWTWLDHKSLDGYARLLGKGAHIVSYEIHNGPVGDRDIDHRCRNRACVNPAHLEAVPHVENVLRGDGLAGRNARKTHCVNGHEFTEVNTLPRICKSGRVGRRCRTCSTLSWQARQVGRAAA